MGNTVARSHIRDADRGVAKATRANTKRNSTGFSLDAHLLPAATSISLAQSSAHDMCQLPPLPPPRQRRSHASRHHSDEPFPVSLSSAPSSAKPAASALDFAHHTSPRGMLAADVALNNDTASAQDNLRPDDNSIPQSPPPRGSLPENRHSFTFGSLQTLSGVAHLAPDVVLSRESDGSSTVSSKHHKDKSLEHGVGQDAPLPSPGSLRTSPAALRRHERPANANISYSRSSASHTTPLKYSSHSSSTTAVRRGVAADEADDPSKLSALSQRRSSPFSQRTTAHISQSVSGSVLRDCQTARTQTPPRVDKPPRARKVVSFNENVHVVTYPAEGSLHCPAAAGDAAAYHGGEGKPTKRRARSVFRLLSKVSSTPPHERVEQQDYLPLETNCFSAHHDSCCGLKRTGVTEVVYDELSPPSKPLRSSADRALKIGRLLSFESSKEVSGGSDLVVSFERARQAVDALSPDVGPCSLQLVKGTVVDDFDYTDRRDSQDNDTLSLSDAHPSRELIDEPEAMGDQFLSPGKESGSDIRATSSFDIVPLWQRLRRVDELDAFTASRKPSVNLSDASDAPWDSDCKPDAEVLSNTSPSALNEPAALDLPKSDSEEVSSHDEETKSAVCAAAEDQQELGPKNIHTEKENEAKKGLSPLSEPWRSDEREVEELNGANAASTEYAMSPARVSGPRSDPPSMADPASDVDQLLLAGDDAASEGHIARLKSLPESECQASSAGSTSSGRTPDAEIEDLRTGPDSSAPLLSKVMGNVESNEKSTSEFDVFEEERKATSLQRLSLDFRGEDSSETSTYSGFDKPQRRPELSDRVRSITSAALKVEHTDPCGDVTELELDPRCLPSHDDYSVGPRPTAQDCSPLAGVYYGASTASPTEPCPPENETVRVIQELADYPEYDVLQDQANLDSIFGSEPNTPVMRSAHRWSGPFNDFDMGDQIGAECSLDRHPNFGDRRTGQPVPEVLLHDWSGTTPVEPSVDLVDSAPNSRSSTSCMLGASPRPHGKGAEISKPSHAQSSRLDVDISKLYVGPGELYTGQIIISPTKASRKDLINTDAKKRYPEEVSRKAWSPSEAVSALSDKGASHEESLGAVVSDQKQSSKLAVIANPICVWSDDDCSWKKKPVEKSELKAKRGALPLLASVPKVLPVDPKLQDFQVTVERKSFSELGYRRVDRAGRGSSFAQGEPPLGRRVVGTAEYRIIPQEPRRQELVHAGRLAKPHRRRRLSNMETSLTRTVRDDGNLFRGVVGRLVSGMHLAKKLVSSGS